MYTTRIPNMPLPNLAQTCFLLLSFLMINSIHSQKLRIIPVDENGVEILYDSTRWMQQQQVDILQQKMKLTYKKPAIFDEIRTGDCFKEYPRLEFILTCVDHQLKSKNEDFLAFIPVYRPPDSAWIQYYFSGSHDVANQMYANQIRAKILTSLGKNASFHGPNADFNWKAYVHYYPTEEAKLKFNADNAVSFPIHLTPNDYYKGKYKYLKALFLQKNGRGFINFWCFYTEQGKKDLDKYWKAIESVFRYED